MDAEPQPLIQTCPESLRQAFAATFSVKMINSILDAVLRCYPEADGASFLVDYCRFFHAYADSATHLDVIFLEDVREFLQKLSAQNLDPISHAKKVKNAVKAWDRQIKKLKLTEPKPSVQDEAQAQERGFFESIFGVFMGSDSYEEEDYSPLPVPKHHIQALYTWNSYQRQQIVSLEASIASLRSQNKQLRNDFNPMLEAGTAELQSLKNYVKNLQDSCHERNKDRTALEEALKDMEAEKKEIQSAKNTEIQKLRQQIAAQDKDNESLRETVRELKMQVIKANKDLKPELNLKKTKKPLLEALEEQLGAQNLEIKALKADLKNKAYELKAVKSKQSQKLQEEIYDLREFNHKIRSQNLLLKKCNQDLEAEIEVLRVEKEELQKLWTLNFQASAIEDIAEKSSEDQQIADYLDFFEAKLEKTQTQFKQVQEDHEVQLQEKIRENSVLQRELEKEQISHNVLKQSHQKSFYVLKALKLVYDKEKKEKERIAEELKNKEAWEKEQKEQMVRFKVVVDRVRKL